MAADKKQLALPAPFDANGTVVKKGKNKNPQQIKKEEQLAKIANASKQGSQQSVTQRSDAGQWRDTSGAGDAKMKAIEAPGKQVDPNDDPLKPIDFRESLKSDGGDAPREGGDKDFSVTKVSMTEKLPFNLFVSFCVTLNTVSIGMEQENSELGSGGWYTMSLLALVGFLVEVFVRCFFEGLSDFIRSPANVADTILVIGAFIDAVILGPSGGPLAHNFRILSVLRMLRLLRLVKIVRVYTAFKELWLLVGGLVNSMKALAWIGIIVVLVLYVCSILVTTEIGQNDDVYGQGPSYDGELWPYKEYFGNIWRSMFTLFQVMTLDDWCDDIVRHVVHRQPAMALFFIAFLMLTAFGLMNVVVGIIVENTLAAAEVADSVVEQQQGQRRKKAIVKLEEILKMSDVDRTGEISKEDLLALGESPVVQDQLNAIGLHFSEALEIFNLLDYERRNRIELSRFAASCHELVGGAKRRDIVQVEITVGTLAQRLDSLDHKFASMEHEVGVLHEMADDFVQNTVRVLTGYDGSSVQPAHR
jgi:voltage-gated sodium channel